MISALQDGPIVCGMAVTQEFEEYEGFAIFNDTTGDISQDHAISIVGYGADEEGTKYWIGRNSWGTWWGYDGYFRIVRGTNNLGIEVGCSWATPSDKPVWVNSTDPNAPTFNERPMAPKTENNKKPLLSGIERLVNEGKKKLRDIEEKYTNRRFMRKPERPLMNDWKSIEPKITEPEPKDYIDINALPDKFQWNAMNGTNYATLARNQHIPQYCGSCWAFGTTSALSDRLSIMRGPGEKMWPEINLAPQVLINEDGGGTCNGGNAPGVMRYIEKNGIPDETCQAYQAKNNPHGSSKSDLNICENCVPGNTSSTFTPGVCSKQENFTLYWVTQYGPVRGVSDMKAEIYQRGPIACGVDATSQFEEYTGGVYSQQQVAPQLNHEISVLGWGVTEQGENYWIGRNSWGTYWGEEGFFRIKMGSDNLGIETDCTWGVPSFDKP